VLPSLRQGFGGDDAGQGYETVSASGFASPVSAETLLKV
jgi:hypothetical protein